MNIQLSELEEKAQVTLKDMMAGFEVEWNGKKICCPWLRWYANKVNTNFLDREWDGILIMQDWWKDEPEKPSPLCEMVNYLEKPEDFAYICDRTNYKLYHSPNWKETIWSKTNKTWLVTNAVWGLRKGANQSGPLPVRIHKAAL